MSPLQDLGYAVSARRTRPTFAEMTLERGATQDRASPAARSTRPFSAPGRRTVEERQQAVLELFAGKATVDQSARRLSVHASTIEG